MTEPRSLRTGRCLCGEVTFEARNPPETFSVCHCRMCRHWTGSALFGLTFEMEDVTWSGAEHIAVFQSSEWAQRGWCRDCGSHLYFRFTAVEQFAGKIELPLGLLDDPSGFRLRSEIFTDEAPDSYALADQGHIRRTRADVHKAVPVMATED